MLDVTFDDGALRIGFGESDWLGPIRPFGAEVDLEERDGWYGAEANGFEWFVVAGRDQVTLATTTTTARAGIATREFAEVAVGWQFDPSRRHDGGVDEHVRGFGFQYCEFCLPTRSGPMLDDWFFFPARPKIVEPVLLVAPDLRTLLIGPMDHFHDQVMVPGPPGEPFSMGWHGDLDQVPEGFTTTIGIIAAGSPRAAIERWAGILRGPNPVDRPGRYADVLGERLSYWTDNGSAYWYKTAPPRDTPDTLVETLDRLREQDVPIGAFQLDSWWYPHQTLRPFDTPEWTVPPTGLIRWETRDDVLPDGVPALRERLGNPPLVTHIRHLSSQSPYLDDFDCWVDGDRAHPKGSDYYAAQLEQARGWGVEVFEHDWLIEAFLGVRGLREAPGRARAWQEGLDAEAGRTGMTMQWCMPSPPDLMQTSTLRNVTSIRTSGDHGYLVGPGVLWSWFCYVNVLARAMGLWPYKDVFRTDGDQNLAEIDALLATMSGGPVGIGDRIGETKRDIVMRTCRADGVLVKPDVPIAAIDRCFARDRVLRRAVMVAECHTDHAAGRWIYATAISYREDVERSEVTVAGNEVGVDGPVFVWDWRSGTGEVVAGDWNWEIDLGAMAFDYRVAAPILGSGLAIVGDTSLYATAGDRRLRSVEAMDAGASIVVVGANETVTITGWSNGAISADVGATNRDAASGIWTLEVTIPPRGWRRVTLAT